MLSLSDIYFGCLGIWAMALLTFIVLRPSPDPFETYGFSSPAYQDCTPDGGVSANRADDNSSGGVTTPEVTWRASGSHSREEIL